MSIVNISSENLVHGSNAEFEILMKRQLQKVIGMQLLNATVPLTYKIINVDVEKILKNGNNDEFKLYPHNTIYVEQSRLSYIFISSNFLNSILQLINIYLAILNIS